MKERFARARRALSVLTILCFGLCAAGCIVSLALSKSRYCEISDASEQLLLLCSILAMPLALLLPRGKQPGLRLVLVGVAVAFFCLVVLPSLAMNRHKPSPLQGRWNLGQVAKAMLMYQEGHEGYLPFDERGPLHSLSLLYPDWISDAKVFQNPFVSRSWKRRKMGATFPDGTSLAGAVSHFGYTWRVSPNAPPHFAIVADMPEFLILDNDDWGVNVLYIDGLITWETTPFCSANLEDNIFAPQPGWSADTDSWIRKD